MIIVRLKGGLGNQLFQYAAARRLSLTRKTELVLDTSWFDMPNKKDTARNFELGHYQTQWRKMSIQENKSALLYSGRILSRLPFPRQLKLFREKQFGFDPRVLTLPDNCFLDGYWQSPRYFEDIQDIIRLDFKPQCAPSSIDEELVELMHVTNSVAVHVRRGDYVFSVPASTVHGICSKDYYERATKHIISNINSANFFVFSDDYEWVRNNLSFPGQTYYVHHNGPDTAFQDLRLMSQCKHNIIANSTFSWWGSWLNDNPNKIIVAPSNWFADGRQSTDLIPASWTRL